MVEALRQDRFPIMWEVIRVRFTQVAWPHSVKFLTRGAAARRHHASRLPLSFPHFRGLRELGVARIEAGLILAEVVYTPGRKAVSDAPRHSPYELSLHWTVAQT